jgi:hypothetical protein
MCYSLPELHYWLQKIQREVGKKGTAGSILHATSITTQKHGPKNDKNQGEDTAPYAELSTIYGINRCTNHYLS